MAARYQPLPADDMAPGDVHVLTAESVISDSSDLSKKLEAGWDDSVPPLSTDDFSEDPKVFARRRKHDPDGIASTRAAIVLTAPSQPDIAQPSVFDTKNGVELYGPPTTWENAHAFDATFRWTWKEDAKCRRRIDFRIFALLLVMFACLELDRANIQQANSNNLLGSLGLTTNDYNLGNTLFRLSFFLAELPSQLVSKKIGPDRWLPIQISLWSIVSASQFWLSGRSSFLITRVLIGVCQGGFIPDVILYLSYFYTNHELPIRLAIFWTCSYLTDIFSAFIAIPILRLEGVGGHHGWQYLFLIEGLLTLVVGIISFFLMPPSVTQTKSWLFPNGWFDTREEKIIVNKVLRDSWTKSTMHNRERLTFRGVWNALCDYHFWPLLAIGVLFGIPGGPLTAYLTLILRSLGFDTTLTNALTIPAYISNIILLLSLTYLSERYKRRALFASLQDLWAIPLLIALLTFTLKSNPWARWVVTVLAVGHPYSHAIQVAWVSSNSNGVGQRCVQAALYNMSVQLSAIIYSNIYTSHDAPLYKRGNTILLVIACVTFCLYYFTWWYYRKMNQIRDRKWAAMTEEQRYRYVSTTRDQGAKRLDHRFVY